MRYQRKRSYRGGDDQSEASPIDSNSNTSLGSQPFNSFGFAHGASSAREAALLTQKNNNEMQHKLNKQSGGKSKRMRRRSRRSKQSKCMQSRSKQSKRKQSRSKQSRSKQSRSKSNRMRSRSMRSISMRSISMRSRSMRSRSMCKRSMYGGADAGIQVPTFPPIGGVTHAYSASDLSVGGNTTLIKGLNDAKGDCYVNDTCNATAGGGSRRRRHNKRY